MEICHGADTDSSRALHGAVKSVKSPGPPSSIGIEMLSITDCLDQLPHPPGQRWPKKSTMSKNIRGKMHYTKKALTRQRNEVSLQLTSKHSTFASSRPIAYRCRRYGHALVHVDPAAEARLRLKIDLYIVPTVALLYLFCFIDRANIGT